VSALLETTRESHAARHGTIKRKDDPWWIINSPLNGWGCKCKKQAYSKREIERRGWKITEGELDNIADKDFAYDTRKGNKLSRISKIDLDSTIKSLPNIQDARNKDYANLTTEEVHQKFFNDLGVASGEVFVDKINDPVVINEELFKTLDYKKATKRDRHLYVDKFAELLRDPDEIYIELEKLKTPNSKYFDPNNRLIKKYLKYYTTQNGAKRALMGLFAYEKDKTLGVSLYFVDSTGTVENKRVSKLIYQRDSKQD